MTLNKNGIVRDPEILSGTPVFRGTRVPFQALLDYLDGGQTLEEFLDDFPTVNRESAVLALEEAKTPVVMKLTSAKPLTPVLPQPTAVSLSSTKKSRRG